MGRFVLRSNIDICKIRVLLRLPRRESHTTGLEVSCNQTSSFLTCSADRGGEVDVHLGDVVYRRRVSMTRAKNQIAWETPRSGRRESNPH